MARILLADDDAAARELVQRALASESHQVVSTQDGAEARKQLKSAPASFDLLISDVPGRWHRCGPLQTRADPNAPFHSRR
jgi:CheY-like chemotaxis protein